MRVLLPVFIFAFFYKGPLWGHPHQFVDCGATFIVNDTLFKGVKVDWYVDEMISAWIISDFGLEQGSTYTGEAYTKYVREAFYEIEKNSYFITATWQHKPLKIYRWSEKTLTVTDQEKLHFSFFIPFDIPLPASPETLLFNFIDETFYIAFYLLKGHLSISGSGASRASLKIVKIQWDETISVTFKR